MTLKASRQAIGIETPEIKSGAKVFKNLYKARCIATRQMISLGRIASSGSPPTTSSIEEAGLAGTHSITYLWRAAAWLHPFRDIRTELSEHSKENSPLLMWSAAITTHRGISKKRKRDAGECSRKTRFTSKISSNFRKSI